MPNLSDNTILIDGTLILNDTLGSFNSATPSSYSDPSNLYATLGSWSDTLGLIEDSSLHVPSPSGYSDNPNTNSNLSPSIQELKDFSNNLLSNLSSSLISNSWSIPDNFSIKIKPVLITNQVFSINHSPPPSSFLVSISFGLSKLVIVDSIPNLKSRLSDIFNGILLFSSSNISFKE